MRVKTQVAGSHLQFLIAQVWGGVENTSFRPVPSCCWSRNHAWWRHAESTPRRPSHPLVLTGDLFCQRTPPIQSSPTGSPFPRSLFISWFKTVVSELLITTVLSLSLRFYGSVKLSSTKLHLEHHNEVTAPLFWKLIRDKPELCQQLTITSVSTMRWQNSSLKQRNQTF